MINVLVLSTLDDLCLNPPFQQHLEKPSPGPVFPFTASAHAPHQVWLFVTGSNRRIGAQCQEERAISHDLSGESSPIRAHGKRVPLPKKGICLVFPLTGVGGPLEASIFILGFRFSFGAPETLGSRRWLVTPTLSQGCRSRTTRAGLRVLCPDLCTRLKGCDTFYSKCLGVNKEYVQHILPTTWLEMNGTAQIFQIPFCLKFNG